MDSTPTKSELTVLTESSEISSEAEMISMADDLVGLHSSTNDLESKHMDFKERRRLELEEYKRSKEAELTFIPKLIPSKFSSPKRVPLYPSKTLADGEVAPLTPRDQMREKLEVKKQEQVFDFKPKINSSYKSKVSTDSADEPSTSQESKFDKLYKDAMVRKQYEQEYKEKTRPSFVPKMASSRRASRSEIADDSAPHLSITEKLYASPGAGRIRSSSVSSEKNTAEGETVASFIPKVTRRAGSRSEGETSQRLYQAALDLAEKKRIMAATLSAEHTFSPAMKSSATKRASSVGRYGDMSTDVVSRNARFSEQKKLHLEAFRQQKADKESAGSTFRPDIVTQSYHSPTQTTRKQERQRSSIVKEAETFSFSPNINNYPIDQVRADDGMTVFDRLHSDDKKRKDRESEMHMMAKHKELEECSFAPTIPQSPISGGGNSSSARFERVATKTKIEPKEETFVPKVSGFVSKDDSRSSVPVHERLRQEAERQRERKKSHEEAHMRAMVAEATFVPNIPETSRRMSNASTSDLSIHERLAQQHKQTPVYKSASESSVGSFSDRALYRSRSMSSAPTPEPTPVKTPLTPEESAELYNRLSERAKGAAERLRILRADPEAGTTSAITPTRSSFAERSLSRFSIGKDTAIELDKTPLTPEAKDSLYSRLTDRAREAAQRLKELRQNPDLGRESEIGKNSAYASFSDRSLYRSKSTPRQQPAPINLAEKGQLKPEEQEQLYSRLIDRARKESIKIREIKSAVTPAGSSYNPEAPGTAVVGPLDDQQVEVFTRLAQPKRPSISDSASISTYKGVESRGLVSPIKEPTSTTKIPRKKTIVSSEKVSISGQTSTAQANLTDLLKSENADIPSQSDAHTVEDLSISVDYSVELSAPASSNQNIGEAAARKLEISIVSSALESTNHTADVLNVPPEVSELDIPEKLLPDKNSPHTQIHVIASDTPIENSIFSVKDSSAEELKLASPARPEAPQLHSTDAEPVPSDSLSVEPAMRMQI